VPSANPADGLNGRRQLAAAQRQCGGLAVEGVDDITRWPAQTVVQGEKSEPGATVATAFAQFDVIEKSN
jgi:hypothetical protein